jgi:hypothetical protein
MKQALQFTGLVTDGKLPREVAEQIGRAIRGFDGKRVVLSLALAKKARSSRQNAFYWSQIVPRIQDLFLENGTRLTPEETHDFLREHVGRLTRIVEDPSGVRQRIIQSSTSLSTIEFEDYLTAIRAWAAALGVALPLPNEPEGAFYQPTNHQGDQHGHP